MSHHLQILYHSKASANENNDTIPNILSASKKNNMQLGVTGILCYSKTRFVQLLEGEETTVIQLYSRIIDDPRHVACQLLHIGFTIERLFPDWAMGYSELPLSDSDIISSLHDTNLQLDNRVKVQKILKSLVTAHKK